jgi:hypothetical protein
MRTIARIAIIAALNALVISSLGHADDFVQIGGLNAKAELVCETKPESRKYEVLSDVPLFPAFSGVGHGEPDLKKAKILLLTLDSDLVASKIGKFNATISGPGGQFDGDITETAASSGIFTDDKQTVRLVLPPGTVTSGHMDAFLSPVISSDTLGLHDARFTLYYHIGHNPLRFVLPFPVTFARVKFLAPYNPAIVNHLEAALVLFDSDPDTGATGGSFDPLSSDPVQGRKPTKFTETAAGSLNFFDPASKVTVRLSHFTGTNVNRINRMDASFFGGLLGPEKQALSLTLTETTANSMEFTEEATMGGNEESGATDLPTDNPEVTGDGVFRVRIRGSKDSVILIVQSDINKVFVTASPIHGDPTTLLSEKLILVPKNSDTNTNYKTIRTLYTAGNAPGANPGVSFYLADTSGAQLDPKDAEGYNDLAWLLATSPNGSLRNGKQAEKLATKACELTLWSNPNFIDTLGAACAEAGDFDDALKWENYSLSRSNITEDETLQGKGHLTLFHARKPYHTESPSH